MSNIIPLHAENFYHIFNRANGKERLFYNERNYGCFLRKFKHLTKKEMTYFPFSKFVQTSTNRWISKGNPILEDRKYVISGTLGKM